MKDKYFDKGRWKNDLLSGCKYVLGWYTQLDAIRILDIWDIVLWYENLSCNCAMNKPIINIKYRNLLLNIYRLSWLINLYCFLIWLVSEIGSNEVSIRITMEWN